MPAPERLELAGLAINRDSDIDVAFVALFCGLRERMLERPEYDIFIDIFFARQRIDQQQNFATHALRLLKSTFGTRRALSTSTSVNSNSAGPSFPSNSSFNLSPSGAPKIPWNDLRCAAPGIGTRNFTSASRP